MKPKKKTKSNDWRDLKKKPSSKAPVSWYARVRRCFIWLRRIFILLMACGVSYAAYFAYKNFYIEDLFSPKGAPILEKHKELKTDGVINKKWIFQYLRIPENATLNDINIIAVKKTLEDLPQIKSASVEKLRRENILRITISERKPMLKYFAKIDHVQQIFLMDSEGNFFKPICLSNDFIERLPTVEGVNFPFKGSASVPSKYQHANKLEEFLGYAQAKGQFENIASIDISKLNDLSMPLIIMKTHSGTRIKFAPKDYPKQFDRLKSVYDYSKSKNYKHLEYIDLPYKSGAVFKPSEYPKNERK